MEKSAVAALRKTQDFSEESLHIGTTNTIYECHLEDTSCAWSI